MDDQNRDDRKNLPVPYQADLPVNGDMNERVRRDLPLGTARWQQFSADARPDWKRGDLLLGYLLETGQGIGIRDDRHVLLTCGTRGGKGTSFIIPNMILHEGSLVCIDPKGENAMVTARCRGQGSDYTWGRGQKVRILDPFGEVESHGDNFQDLKVRFNPLAGLGRKNPYTIDDAGRIVEALIPDEGNETEPYWSQSARMVTHATILHVVSANHYKPHERNLITVRKLLMQGDLELRKLIEMNAEEGDKIPSALSLLFRSMARNDAFDGQVSQAGEMWGNLLASSPRTLAGIIQTALSNLSFLASPYMRDSVSASDFEMSELKTDPKGVSLYLVLPIRYMPENFRWLRMVTSLLIGEMEKTRGQPKSGHPVLMVLDEFPALKRMRVIENAAAQIAGFGVKMLFVSQTLGQLKEVYKDNWETFVANAGVKIFACNDDNFTREYVSKLVGETEVVRVGHNKSESHGHSSSTTHGSSQTHSDSVTRGSSNSTTTGYSGQGLNSSSTSSTSYSRTRGFSQTLNESHTEGKNSSNSWGESETIHKRMLLTPDEVGRLFGDREMPRALALISGYQPLFLKRRNYHDSETFAGYFDPHPSYPLPPTRAVIFKRREEEKRQKEAAIRRKRMEALHKAWMKEQARRAQEEEEFRRWEAEERTRLALEEEQRARSERRHRMALAIYDTCASLMVIGIYGFLIYNYRVLLSILGLIVWFSTDWID